MNSNNNGCHQANCACQRCSNGKLNCTGLRTFRAIDAACIPPSNPEPSMLAYGSFYNLTEFYDLIIPVTPPALGQKIIFTTPGPTSGVNPAPIPNNTTDLQVTTSGVYEISMNISVDLVNASNDSFNSDVRFGLFINDTIMVPESVFESINFVTTTIGAPSVTVEIGNTIGNTIQIRLNKDDRLSIRVITASASVSYRFPTLVVTKIDN